MCAVLGEARSSFYHAATPTATARADAQIGLLIEAVFKRHRRRYGYRRIAEELSEGGVVLRPDQNPPDHGSTRLARPPAQKLRAQNQ
ncbi:MAG: hypothetical protein M3463_00735 [Verrucomicrobiota bacterium]|nr:hypothetical protein [Verrucomicrobiota bacterium]